MSKPIASIGRRFTSHFIDDVLALGLGVVLFAIARELELPLALGFLGFLSYRLLCDGLRGGESLGSRLTRIAVVHAVTEEPCRYWRSLVRNFSLVLGVLDVVFILGKQRRRLGDYLAGTKVVQLDALE